jgi:hypothetical protein
MQSHVILGHAHLFRDLDDLNLDIDLDERFGQRVNLDETGVDGAIEATELGDQADISLRNGFVRVGTADAAWDRSEEANAGAEIVDCDELATARISTKHAAYPCFHTTRACRHPHSPPAGSERTRAGGPRDEAVGR